MAPSWNRNMFEPLQSVNHDTEGTWQLETGHHEGMTSRKQDIMTLYSVVEFFLVNNLFLNQQVFKYMLIYV